jgi:GPH family glycoside/pentoside/hexuronide:cation symporter
MRLTHMLARVSMGQKKEHKTDLEKGGAAIATTIQLAPSAPVPLGTKLAYGFGAVAYGIKDNGFSVFLLLFYNQIVGLPAESVGLIIGLALIADAFIDPVIGSLSDRTRTRWGRRHPWLYGSALPIALSWLMLWNPPEASMGVTLGYLFTFGLLVRASLSCNEVPSLALTPELTSDYTERTLVVRYRYLFGWAGGILMLALAYGVILVPGPGYPNGTLNPAGYPRYAMIGALIMFVSILVSAIGTHKRLARPIPGRPQTADSIRDIVATLRYRPFMILMIAALFGYAAQGITFALTNYLLEFIWQFSAAQFLIFALVLFGSAVVAFLVIAPIAKRTSKQRGAAATAVVAVLFGSGAYWLRFFGIAPDNGDPLLLPLVLSMIGIGNAAFISSLILTASMVADVTDHAAKATGRQTEGLFYAGFFFVQKSVTGLGIFLSGMILGAVGFPEKAAPGSVPDDILSRLILVYGLAVAILGTLSALSYLRYPLSGREEPDAQGLQKVAATAEPPVT